MRIPGISKTDDDGSTRLVALAAIAALLLGAIFLVCAIPDVRPGAASAPAHAAPSKSPPPGTGAGGAASTSGQGARGAPPAATEKPAATGESAATAKPAAVDTPPVSGGAAATGQLPAATASAQVARPAGTGASAFPQDKETRNAARCAALLWAFACCAVGAFLGFIFGIPRSLSSDTARTTVPQPARSSDTAKAKRKH